MRFLLFFSISSGKPSFLSSIDSVLYLLWQMNVSISLTNFGIFVFSDVFCRIQKSLVFFNKFQLSSETKLLVKIRQLSEKWIQWWFTDTFSSFLLGLTSNSTFCFFSSMSFLMKRWQSKTLKSWKTNGMKLLCFRIMFAC